MSTGRLRLLLSLILVSATVLLLHQSPKSKDLINQATGRYKPSFKPAVYEDDDGGYGLKLVDEEFEDESSRWGISGIVDGWVKKKPSLLITGGAGQLGQALIPKLSEDYQVHILDIASKPTNLPEENVFYHRGSVLPPSTSLPNLLKKYHFQGIIHLASVSLDSWCSAKKQECKSVNEGGVKALMKHVGAITSEKAKTSSRSKITPPPWIILGSGMDVYGSTHSIVDEKTERKPDNSLGWTQLLSEVALHMGLQKEINNGIRGMILRFSNIYGYPIKTTIPESFMTDLITSSVTNLNIQYDSDLPPIDSIHYEDAVEGVVKAVGMMNDKTKKYMPLTSVNLVAGGRKWKITDLVNRVRELTESMSSIRDIGNNKEHKESEFSNSLASSFLNWSPSITLYEGLKKTLMELTQSMHSHSLDYIHNNCPTSNEFPPSSLAKKTHPADERNKKMDKLDGCTVNVAFEHESFLHHLKCDDGKHCTADGTYVDGYNWNASVWILHAKRIEKESGRKVFMSFEEEKGTGWLGSKKGLNDHDEVEWELVRKGDPLYDTEFEVEVAADSSTMRLAIPGRIRPGIARQIHAVANISAQTTWFTLEEPEHLGGSHFDMRMNVLCCPREGDWPLVLDDYESSDMRFGRTGQIPFNASRRSATCSRSIEAARYTTQQLRLLSDTSADLAPKPAIALTEKPHDWAKKDLPTCWNDCSSATVCVQTGSCRCVQAECPKRRENPILALKKADRKKPEKQSPLGSLAAWSDNLVQDVSRISFEDLLLPPARSYLTKHSEFIKVYVVDGYEGQEAVEQAECHKLANKHCFSADSIMYKGMRSIQVGNPDDADLLVLPVYQHCKDAGFMVHDVMAYARENIKGVREGDKRISVVMTHDWGICISFAWQVWEARNLKPESGKPTLYPDWILDNTLVMSVMGDWDTNCYRPHQDVVIPARSCQSNNLRETFSSVEKVKPMRDRPQLISWAGTYWGTGKSDRLRLTCSRGGAGEKELVKGAGAMSSFSNWDYMNDLRNARFCPQPRGIAGWSPRTSDAIYAGCIPVLIAEGTHYPFADFLDWTKFSVRVESTELDHIEQILANIPLEKIEEMQANLMVVREGFLYSTDEHPEDEKNRKGPMWFALHEAGMRLRTKYPKVEI